MEALSLSKTQVRVTEPYLYHEPSNLFDRPTSISWEILSGERPSSKRGEHTKSPECKQQTGETDRGNANEEHKLRYHFSQRSVVLRW